MHPDWLRPAWRAEGVGALMTTRRGGVSAPPFDTMNVRDGLGDDPHAVRRNQQLLHEATGATPVYLQQVHGARVVRLTQADLAPGAPLHEADASVTTEHGIACTSQVADCLPVLFAAPGGVAAAHAGWRGLAAGVPGATVAALGREFGSAPRDLIAAVGPSISAARYEVGDEVRARFVAAGFPPAQLERWFRPAAADHWLFDGWRSVTDQLEAAGVVADGIHGCALCTASDPRLFCSYRRDGKGAGRIAAAIRRSDARG
jgi:YfiH family protein